MPVGREFATRARPFLLMWLLESITLRHPHMLPELDRILAALATMQDDHGALWRQEARTRRGKPS